MRWTLATCTFHQSAKSRTSASVFGPTPPITIGISPSGTGPAGRRAAGGGRRRDRRPRLTRAPGPPPASPAAARTRARGSRRPGPEGGELLGHRTPADAEVEAPAGRVVDGHGLAGQDGRVPEGIAEDERADAQPLGVGGQPGRRDHRLVHRLVIGQRRREVVHPRDPDEAGGLRRPSAFDELREGHPHLRKEQVELHGRCPSAEGALGSASPACRSVTPHGPAARHPARDLLLG